MSQLTTVHCFNKIKPIWICCVSGRAKSLILTAQREASSKQTNRLISHFCKTSASSLHISSCSCNTGKWKQHQPRRHGSLLMGKTILPLSIHSSPAAAMHLTSHVSSPCTPLSTLIEGWGTVTDLSSVRLKGTTDSFAYEGLNMHKRPKRVRAGESTTLCDPNMQTYTLWTLV